MVERNPLISLFFTALFTGLLLIGCSGDSVIENTDSEETGIFKDPDGLFVAEIPVDMEYTRTGSETLKVHEFVRKDDDGDTMEILRFTIGTPESGTDADVFSPNYESSYASTCNCNIIERGVVNFKGGPSRQYRVGLRGGTWISYQRHTVYRNKTIVIGIRGPVENIQRIEQLFTKTVNSFHFKKDQE